MGKSKFIFLIFFTSLAGAKDNEVIKKFATLKNNITYLLVYKNTDKELLQNSFVIVDELLKTEPDNIKIKAYKESFNCAYARDTINLFKAKSCISNLQKLVIKPTDNDHFPTTILRAVILATFPGMFSTSDEAIQDFKTILESVQFKKLPNSDKAVVYAYYAVATETEGENASHTEKLWEQSYNFDKDVAKKLQDIN